MSDNYWPEDWNLRDKAEWRIRTYQVKARHFVRKHRALLLVIAALVAMFFHPELVRVVRFLLH